MQLKKVSFKNLLAYGNYITEIDLTKNILTIIVGKNGSGKTSLLLDSICYALFGRLFRDVKKKQYINSITKKELLVELEFLVGSDTYLVRRGQKPDVFDIIKNNVMLPASVPTSAHQDLLESIIGMNFKSFCQVVILGDKYVPFLSLPALDRRKIVENILDLEVFSVMNIKAKEELSGLNDSIKQSNLEKTILENRIDEAQKYIERQTQDKQKILDVLNNRYADLDADWRLQTEELEVATSGLLPDEEVDKHKSDVVKFKDALNKITSKLTQVDFKKSQIKQEIAFWEELGECCPTCKQSIQKELSIQKLSELESDCQKCEDGRQVLIKRLDDGNEILAKVQNTLKDNDFLKHKVLNLNSNIKKLVESKNLLTTQISSFTSEDTSKEVDYSVLLSNLQADLVNLSSTLNDLYKQKEVYVTLIDHLKDDGFKAHIIRGYVDLINELMNKFLMEMEFFCEFYFDAEFNETIKSRYRDQFTYQSFSAGQKLRIDLAILAAWRELAKRRNSVSVNLLIFDEVLSSALDSDGVNDLIQILKKANMADNCFVISHSDTCINLIENSIEVEIVKSFSHVNLEKY